MKVLVTGASGFVGGHLCTRLIQEGHEVYGLMRCPKSDDYGFEVIQGDLSLESIGRWLTLLPQQLDVVVHTAGVVHSFDEATFERVNYQGTVDLEQALKKHFPKLHYIFTSSLAAVGPSAMGKPHTEETPLNPPSAYGQSKKKAEEYLQENLSDKWQLTIIRPPMVIGPRDQAVLDVFKMVKSRVILGTGFRGMKKQYSFICVHDLVEVMIKCMAPSEQRVRVYFPAFPEVASFQVIIDTIKQQMNVVTITLPIPMKAVSALAWLMALIKKVLPIDVRLTPDKIHELRPMYWTVSSEKSIRELEINYKWSLQKTIELTYQDYKKRQWL